MDKQEITLYRFLSEVRAFLAKLVKEPIDADISKYLKDCGVTRSGLLKDLIKRGVVERSEKILDSTNSEEKAAKYVVKYKIKRNDFENKVHKLYIKYFEKNLPDKPSKKEVNECDGGECGGDINLGGTSTFSVGVNTTRGDIGYSQPLGLVRRKGISKKNSKKKIEPKDIVGKTITAETSKPKKIYITEKQYKTLLEKIEL